MRVTVDEAGRVQVPQELLDGLHIGPGSELQIWLDDEAAILVPAERMAHLEREGDHWVIVHPDPSVVITQEMTNSILEELRNERGMPHPIWVTPEGRSRL